MSEDAVLGSCEVTNAFFVGQLAIVLSTALIWLASLTLRRRSASGSAQADFGKPWVFIDLSLSIAFWGVAPIVAFFVAWRVLLSSVTSSATTMACIMQATFPVIPALFAVAGALMHFLYRPQAAVQSYVATLADRLTDRAAAQGTPLRVLMLSATVRGMLYVGLVRELQQRRSATTGSPPAVSVSLVDLAGVMAYCVSNGAACGLDPAAHFDFITFTNHAHVHSSASTRLLQDGPEPETDAALDAIDDSFRLNASDASFDAIVLPLGLRYMDPLGGMLASPQMLRERMRILLKDASRVLKRGGYVIVMDSCEATCFTRSDCESVGFVMARTTFSNVHYATWRCWPGNPKIFECHGSKADEDGSGASMALELEPVTRSLNPNPSIPRLQALFIVVAWQIATFGTLMAAAGALYAHLSVPRTIVVGQRFGNLLPQLTCNYPLMAHFARSVLAREQRPASSIELLRKVAFADAKSVGASLAMSSLFFVPTFVIQIALNDTDLSEAAKSYIGLAVSLCLGFAVTRWHVRRRRELAFKLYGVDPAMVDSMG